MATFSVSLSFSREPGEACKKKLGSPNSAVQNRVNEIMT